MTICSNTALARAGLQIGIDATMPSRYMRISEFGAPLLLFILCSAGCTHTQLACNTVSQSATLTALYEKQVLDNLAMFQCNHYAIPFFSVPNQAQSNVLDQGAFSSSALIAFRQ